MPNREDETYINIVYDGHPPNCTCVECNKNRVRYKQTDITCPECGSYNLILDTQTKLYQCRCKAIFTEKELEYKPIAEIPQEGYYED